MKQSNVEDQIWSIKEFFDIPFKIFIEFGGNSLPLTHLKFYSPRLYKHKDTDMPLYLYRGIKDNKYMRGCCFVAVRRDMNLAQWFIVDKESFQKNMVFRRMA